MTVMIIILKATVAVEKCLDQIFMELTWVLVGWFWYVTLCQLNVKGMVGPVKFCMV